MINIGIYLELKNTENIDFTSIKEGNPGVGGTAYVQVLMATYLNDLYSNYRITIYVENEQIFPNGILQRRVKDDVDAIEKAYVDNVDLFIFVAKYHDENFYKLIDKYKVKSISWVHNYINYKILNELYYTEYIQRVIFVGQQHYDAYIDDKIMEKSSYIYNIVPTNPNFIRENITNKKIVTYIGALHKSKGFDVLAKQWKNILIQVPDAKLYVIGSGNLYDRSTKLGKYGIAESSYEQKFVKYILDSNGNILDSIIFCGTLGKEKEEIFKKTSVGVPNPSGKTETFCLSAVELEACGIPVVTYNGYGLLDTVKNNRSGFLSRSGRCLTKGIVKLLKNESLNSEMGNKGIVFSKSNFAPEILMPYWDKLFFEVLNDVGAENLFSYKNFRDDWKWLKYFNYKFKQVFNTNKPPSIAFMVSYVKETIKALLLHH